MGMFDSFLGKGDGYTGAQRTGLQRSAEIKKKRKEEERAFEKTQKREEGARALTERGIMEAGETRRARIGEAGATERERMSSVGQMARQRLVGEQGVEAATTKAIRGADVKSMEYGRKLTLGEIGHERAKELAEIKAKAEDPFGLRESPGDVARGGLEGNQKEYSFSQFTGLNREKQTEYMARMKSKDPKKYLDFARQYKLLAAPKEESPGMDMGGGGRSIYQSDSGTYRNF